MCSATCKAVPTSHLILFTDLDGTLLDHHSYSWAAAQEALEEIERQHVPLVFCTSKTRAEVDALRRKMGTGHPYITENGGGIFFPHGYFPQRIAGATSIGRQHCIALGRRYAEVAEALDAIAAESRVEVVGFHHMTAREIAQNTNLEPRQAELARLRDFDEPFFFAGGGKAAEKSFMEAARGRGFQTARGGRFWHLFAGSDKGRAVRRLMQLYRGAFPRAPLHFVALGDSGNDLPMLEAAGRAVLVPQPGGNFDKEVLARLPRITRALAPGPAGWNQAVLNLLRPTVQQSFR
jgi:mannosyl-3-phosphoglycerate phosphatase